MFIYMGQTYYRYTKFGLLLKLQSYKFGSVSQRMIEASITQNFFCIGLGVHH
jgi:hypothetical protein